MSVRSRIALSRRCAALVVGAASLVAVTGCETNPTTGRSQYAALSREEERQIGEEQSPALTEEFGGKVADPQLQAYVTDIGRRLAATTRVEDPQMADLPWEFTLLNSDVVNAFALPGGKVFVSKGLAKEMTNEAQMAAVVGHEIGHVTARHTSERYGQQIAIVGGTTIVGAIIGAAVSSDDRAAGAGIGAGVGAAGGGIWALSYSRDQEVEADRLGMRYMERLKYNPQGAIQVQEILQREAAKGGGGNLEILSTHPTSETRIKELNKRMEKYYQHTKGNPEYTFGEERFRSQFLSRLAALPETEQPGRPMMLAAVGVIDLNQPRTWCAHCAAAAEAGAQR